MREYLLYLAQLILLFGLYFITARIGLSFDAVSGFASLVWLPSGIALSAILIFGYRVWPAITIAAFLVNNLQGASYPVAIGIGIGNTLEAITAAYLLRYFDFKNTLDKLKEVLIFLLVAIPVGALLSATIGVTSLWMGGTVSLQSFWATWGAWWIGDVISILVVTPLVLTWRVLPKRKGRKRMIESMLIASLTVAIGIFVFLYTHNSVLTYLIFPPLILICLRFTQREAATATFVLLALAVWGTVNGLGSFANGELSESLLLLQGYMVVVIATSLILSAIAAERRQLEQRKDDFIAIAGHEMRVPISSAKMYIQLVRTLIIKKKIKQIPAYITKIDTQIEKSARLIDDLLDVSRIQAGKLELKTEAFSMKELLRETIESVAETNPSHKISLKPSGRNDWVFADRVRIGQVITNLLVNAIKYSPKKSRVIVKSVLKDNRVIVSIRDFGIGIASTDQEKIFTRYYRIDSTFPGFGVGLYISSEIIKEAGGELWVESKKGRGSTFHFSLPLS
jgi:signal transduction histidine kinase